jgi:hypothetical protein
VGFFAHVSNVSESRGRRSEFARKEDEECLKNTPVLSREQ